MRCPTSESWMRAAIASDHTNSNPPRRPLACGSIARKLGLAAQQLRHGLERLVHVPGFERVLQLVSERDRVVAGHRPRFQRGAGDPLRQDDAFGGEQREQFRAAATQARAIERSSTVPSWDSQSASRRWWYSSHPASQAVHSVEPVKRLKLAASRKGFPGGWYEGEHEAGLVASAASSSTCGAPRPRPRLLAAAAKSGHHELAYAGGAGLLLALHCR
jgi:hypothetical protein